MKNQTNQTALFNLDFIKANRTAQKTFTTSANKTAPQANTATDTKQATRDRLQELMQERNDLLQALNTAPALDVINTLCDTIAQISVYKTLLKLADSPKDISTNGSKMCEKLYRDFVQDMAIYRTKDTAQNFSDAMDLYNIAYTDIWQYLNTKAPLSLTDTVLTITKKNGNEKNYTIFQSACKSIRDYIRTWSKSDEYKKLHYIVGIADNGAQVTTSKRPQDNLQDITAQERTAFFNRYGLTAQEQEILSLVIDGKNADTIADTLNIPRVTAYKQIARAKAKFTTAQAYADYITAKNAEKRARAQAEKNANDATYQTAHTKAQERTAQALQAWRDEFNKGGKR